MEAIDSSMSGPLRKVNIPNPAMPRVNEICASMPKEAKTEFEKCYGRILDLLRIPVDPAFMRALIHFWEPEFRCFRFPHFDIVPTIEEYDLMTKWPKSGGVFFVQEGRISSDKVAKLIGLPSHLSILEGNGVVKGWKLSILEEHLSLLGHQKNWITFNKTLALILFGIILFPFHEKVVDHAAIDAFLAWDARSNSLVPSILVDTLLAIDLCRQKSGKQMRWCNPLLYVWAYTHFFAKNHMGKFPDPLRSFPRIPSSRKYAMAWKAEMEGCTENTFTWMCPWFRSSHVLVRCGQFSSLPLMGLRGCIAYSPKLVLRQLGRTQTLPNQEDFGGICFLYLRAAITS
ncbi:uncharacterized protein LOC109790160 [Cajanus cajan]|uniref:uncharacterized protein LOC109790160 n=1 Tax=Cajanus cajan TaxID=3821 RepID=UPI00098DC7F3|nr:uncharacterized protein LOC109790160 [Cajanus cajan]